MNRIGRTLAVVAALALVTAACAGDGTTTGGSPTPTPSIKTKAPGVITVGTDIPYEPFEFRENGEYTGFDVELLEAIVSRFEGDYEVVWKDAIWDTIFPNLAAGRFDVVAGAGTAYAVPGSPAEKDVDARAKIVAFSDPYYSSLQSLTVNTAETPDITSIDDLESGDKVAVQGGTTGKAYAEQELGDKGVEIVVYPKAPAAIEALQIGRVQAVMMDLPAAQGAIEGKDDLEVVQQLESGEQYGFFVAKDNPGLLAAINAGLEEVLADGTYATIFNKYFPDQDLPSYASE